MAGRRFRNALQICVLAMASAAGTAAAQSWGGALGMASDNVYRGVSLSAGLPAWLADLHYIGERWTLGVAAGAERTDYDSPAAQLTFYMDRRWQLDADWSARLGLTHYESPWNFWHNELNYSELTASLAWRGRWRLALALSPDTPGTFDFAGTPTGFAAVAELSYRQPLGERLSLHAGLGYADLTRAADLAYAYGSAGLSYRLGDVHVYSSLQYATAGARRYNTASYEEHPYWVNSVVWNF
jgi:uncharacterized protein (TIGR02001 family)